ncbi:hypothetical protein SAMN05216345_1339 [Cupriavidus sp. YR651]|nr:hypothetical protein [Cupriavidus sp. YR651]SDE01892.1 hypothetical protein SAMN05216345_1339 [Cupriavidus sp. YR651]
MKRTKPEATRTRAAGPDHQVVSAMAVANGVPEDDFSLAKCRD